MNLDNHLLSFVMAGGTGSRLHPLSAHRCKPALPFGARHRVVDFVLSNLANSGLRRTRLLVQYRPEQLRDHVRHCWTGQGEKSLLGIDAPRPGETYRGTADAVAQNLHIVHAVQPDIVAVFGADHAYRMDVRQMIDFHLTERADVTIATLPVPLAEAGAFGIVETDARQKVRAFHEKPTAAAAAPSRPGHALASMGNYLFSADVLCRALARMHQRGGTDFGHDVLPELLAGHRVMAYDFHQNRVPGPSSPEPNYWRDVGTVDAYFQAQLDTLGPAPRLPLQNLSWPIAPARFEGPAAELYRSEVIDSQLGAGVRVEGARLQRVLANARSHVGAGTELSETVLMEGVRVGAGARLGRVIVDEDNAIPPGEVIGHDLARDRARFPVSPGGVVVVPRGHFRARTSRLDEPALQAQA